MTNVKFSKKDTDGIPIVTQNYRTVSEDGFRTYSVSFIAVAGELTAYDLLLDTDILLHGGWSWVGDTASWGDQVHMSVIDKDDVLGLFDLLGLTEGEDVLELSRYIVDIDVPPGGYGKEGHHIHTGTFADLVEGLYLRVRYSSEGDSDVEVIAYYDLYEVDAL